MMSPSILFLIVTILFESISVLCCHVQYESDGSTYWRSLSSFKPIQNTSCGTLVIRHSMYMEFKMIFNGKLTWTEWENAFRIGPAKVYCGEPGHPSLFIVDTSTKMEIAIENEQDCWGNIMDPLYFYVAQDIVYSIIIHYNESWTFISINNQIIINGLPMYPQNKRFGDLVLVLLGAPQYPAADVTLFDMLAVSYDTTFDLNAYQTFQPTNTPTINQSTTTNILLSKSESRWNLEGVLVLVIVVTSCFILFFVIITIVLCQTKATVTAELNSVYSASVKGPNKQVELEEQKQLKHENNNIESNKFEASEMKNVNSEKLYDVEITEHETKINSTTTTGHPELKLNMDSERLYDAQPEIINSGTEGENNDYEWIENALKQCDNKEWSKYLFNFKKHKMTEKRLIHINSDIDEFIWIQLIPEISVRTEFKCLLNLQHQINNLKMENLYSIKL